MGFLLLGGAGGGSGRRGGLGALLRGVRARALSVDGGLWGRNSGLSDGKFLVTRRRQRRSVLSERKEGGSNKAQFCKKSAYHLRCNAVFISPKQLSFPVGSTFAVLCTEVILHAVILTCNIDSIADACKISASSSCKFESGRPPS
jgi:hypothetical protein